MPNLKSKVQLTLFFFASAVDFFSELIRALKALQFQPDDSITNARITHVQVNTKTATIAAAANEAGVLFWSFSRSRQSGSLVFNQKKTSLTRPVKLVTWFQKSTLSPLLACANDDQGALLREQQIQEASHDDLTVTVEQFCDNF